MQRLPGSVVQLTANYWDGPLPEDGDLLRTRAGSCYRVDAVRLTRPGSRSRAVLTCTKLERDAVADGDPGVWRWTFGRR